MLHQAPRTAVRMATRYFSSGVSLNFETVYGGSLTSNCVITCEHAGNDLPEGSHWGESDLQAGLPSKHWAYDPGAKEFSSELGFCLKAPAVMSRYSRLFVDLNRPIASHTLARQMCDNHIVDLNMNLTPSSIADRISRYYLPYHFEVERVACVVGARVGISVHTYTCNYEGSLRDFEVGVLYSTKNEGAAHKLVDMLNNNGVYSKVNAPWSGKDGFMHSIDCFSHNGSIPGQRSSLMFEFRNDVCQDVAWRSKVISIISPLLKTM